ncbi:MAG TPA: DNA polymerase [Dermatophilaceae bacterium]|nr:DNA polymerase [Dermatophilaceae bacterium]
MTGEGTGVDPADPDDPLHDELVLECDEGDAARVAALAKETMENVASLAVPLTVETARGTDWAAAK